MYRRHFIATCLLASGVGVWAGNNLANTNAKTNSKTATILVVGDSLSAEYGLKRGSGWAALLTQRLQAEKINATVVNASISGDTTAGGRARLPALLAQHKPTHMILELGGNDALRGLPLQLSQDNLSQMTKMAQQAGAKVLLIGMEVPPNYGADYSARFAATFKTVASTNNAALVPFFLKGVADVPNALQNFQADRIHPKEEAHPVMLNNVWPVLKRLLK